MKNLYYILNTRIEEEMSILIIIGILIVLAVICLTIVKKIKEK